MRRFLADKYLNTLRPNVVRSFAVVLQKALIGRVDSAFVGKEKLLVHCLGAISKTHSEIYEHALRERLPRLATTIDDDGLQALVVLLESDLRIWEWVPENLRERVRSVIGDRALVKEFPPELFGLLSVGELRDSLLQAAGELEPEMIARYPRPEFRERAKDLYREADTFRRAEAVGTAAILPLAPFFDPGDIQDILDIAASNGQVWYAGGTPDILDTLFHLTTEHLTDTASAWNRYIHYVVERTIDRRFHCVSIQNSLKVVGRWEAPPSPPSPPAPLVPPPPAPPPPPPSTPPAASTAEVAPDDDPTS